MKFVPSSWLKIEIWYQDLRNNALRPLPLKLKKKISYFDQNFFLLPHAWVLFLPLLSLLCPSFISSCSPIPKVIHAFDKYWSISGDKEGVRQRKQPMQKSTTQGAHNAVWKTHDLSMIPQGDPRDKRWSWEESGGQILKGLTFCFRSFDFIPKSIEKH